MIFFTYIDVNVVSFIIIFIIIARVFMLILVAASHASSYPCDTSIFWFTHDAVKTLSKLIL